MAPVSQRFIDLLNVPLAVLRDIGEDKQITGWASMRKWPLAHQLSELPRTELERRTLGFLYAGQTSVTFFRLAPPQKAPKDDKKQEPPKEGDGASAPAPQPVEQPVLEGTALDPKDVDAALRALSSAGDPYNETSRPASVTREPQLVVARKRDYGSVLATFVSEGSVAEVIHEFQIAPVVGDEFFSAVIYPAEGLVEVRTGHQRANSFGRTWLKEFGKKFDLEPSKVTITEGDFTALGEELEAGTAAFRGKNTSGGAVDTIEVKVAPGFRTLLGDKTFEDKTTGTEQQQGDMVFDSNGTEYKIRVSRIQGSIYYVKPAPEAVLDHVREALRRVKVRHLRDA
jgi:hypothetical protein